MGGPLTFNSIVATRTRVADQILQSAEYLSIYVSQGGRPEDLRQVVDLGQRAELQHQEQTLAHAAGGAAIESVQIQFGAMHGEYHKIKAALRVVEKDLRDTGASVEVLRTVRQILIDESEKVLLPAPDEGAPTPKGAPVPDQGAPAPEGAPPKTKRRRAVRSRSREAFRAEVQKDVGLLIQLEAAHTALAERKVDLQRLKKLQSDAQALTGKLATRTERKGEAKGKTRTLRGTVTEQRRVWGTIYPLLELAGQADPRIAELLTSTRKR
ncbi:MAG TPA: hypothetical protein VH877_13885 [Polyangia bacterium]|jgi:hypothetical protein|nr:hypothetical protein [Polyangia bacterium]